MIVDVDINEARRIGMARRTIHQSHSSSDIFDDEYQSDIIGVSGEMAFAQVTGLSVDENLYLGGDNGVDFTFIWENQRYTVDVKTTLTKLNMLIKADDIDKCADVLVMAYMADWTQGQVELVGWEHKSKMKEKPTKDCGHGFVNHCAWHISGSR